MIQRRTRLIRTARPPLTPAAHIRFRGALLTVTLFAITPLAATACGGGSDRLSTDDFRQRLAEVCDELQSDLDELGEPESLDDVARLSRQAKNLLDGALADFGRIVPPEALAKDYVDFLKVVTEQSSGAADLRDAARDGDEAAAEAVAVRLEQLQRDKDRIVDDLGVPECLSDAAGSTTDTLPDPAAGGDTTAPTTAPAATLPITLVPDTAAPDPAPVPTDGPVSVPFQILDLATDWQSPPGYTLEPNSPDDSTLQLLADDPDLAADMYGVGVADVVDTATGEYVATLWVGVTYDPSIGMPGRWKSIDCPTGDLVTSPVGIVGILCQGEAGSVYTATDGGVGLSVYALGPDVDPVAIADAFLTANL